ncbi:MAG: nucleotidyl transferase AbiEii/AbiGii toxin family protein [Balneolaceae bacterium]|nr:nucleotidyl transferase AbiEii/AbiGii toxin family protein [Balneolaceae bacterium]
MNLHEDGEIFRDAIRATADHKNIREIYIEKDYWVTYALHTIFHSEMKDVAVFKGGTSLSKCYQAINRFSEDIDLVVLEDPGLSNNQMDKRVRDVSKVVDNTDLEEVELPGITMKRGKNRKVAYEYAKHEYGQAYGQVRDKIIVEVSRLGHFEPHEKVAIHSFIADMMKARGQEALIPKYGLAPFQVKVLRIERTFCEKIMSLVRFSHAENPYEDLGNKVRHTYDIHMLLKQPMIQDFFESQKLDEMLLKVGSDDIESYGDKYDWLYKHPASALLFDKPQETWDKIKPVYNATFKELVIGDLPEGDAVLQDIKRVAERLKYIDWKL